MGGAQVVSQCTAVIQPEGSAANVNLRAGAGRSYAIVRQLPTGTAGLTVLESRPDAAKEAMDGRVFQWLLVALPDGLTGWVRDDLVIISGNCGAAGYGVLKSPERPSTLTPGASHDSSPVTEPPTQEETPTDTPKKPALLPNDTERARSAAFAITAGFEGRGYDAYQNYDSGIVSYGRFQFTLASGSLERVLVRYLEKASGPSPDLLRASFMPRVREKDLTLREDEAFRTLLLGLAADPAMQAAQDAIATETYWDRALINSSTPRGIETPLGQAFVFDMAINHGAWGAESTYLRAAEQALGVEIKSRLGDNGLSEEDLLLAAAKIRRERLYALANARGWGGLKPRADFWLDRMTAGDWNLQGDQKGEVALRADKKVQVKDPK